MVGRILNGPDFKSPNFLTEVNQSVGEYLWKILQQSSIVRECLIDATTGQKLSIDEVISLSTNLAIHLQNLKCGPDTIVGIISENRPEFLIVVLATFFTGATLTCFNPMYTAGELKHTFNISRPSIIFCSSTNKIKNDIRELTSNIQHIIFFDDDKNNENSALLFSDLTKATNTELLICKKDPESTAAILYSSGTTGIPKGVNITQKNIVFILKLMRDENIFGIRKMSTIINFAPMFHAYGLFLLFQAIVNDIRVVSMRKFDEIIFLQNIERYKVKLLFLVPPLVMFLLKDPKVDDFDLSSVEKILCGAAPLKSENEKAIKKKLKLRSLVQAYGMTEITFVGTLRNKRTWKMGSSGAVVPGSKIKILDTQTNEILPPEKLGEICVKGPQVTKGYYGNPKETSNLFDRDGWLHTGDIGYYDDDGDIFIVDRLKDLIKYNAYQVSPAEIEGLLLKHDEVKDAAVIGAPNDVHGEVPAAFVVRKPSSTITEEQLVEYVAALVSPQKKLKGGVVFIDEIPKNPSGKILRRKLVEMYKSLKSKY